MADNKGLVTLTDQKDFLQSLIDSKKLPSHIKTVEDAFTVAQMGKELGFPTLQAMHYIIPVQGRLTLSAKATAALLRKGGIKFRTLEDGMYVYNDGSISEYAKTDPKPIDQRTVILFIRDGMEEKVSFTMRDAEAQGLTGKDNWLRLRKEMLYARCLAKGANRIGQDLLLGLYTAEEMTDSLNVPETQIKRNEEGEIETIDTTHEEVTEDNNPAAAA
jgi:hypothetical protein